MILTTQQLIDYFKSQHVNAGFIDKLKILYRPFICPFGKLLSYIDKDDKVFDVGCGSGQFALLVAHFTEAKSIAGVEINERLINNANQLLNQYAHKVELSFSVYDGKSFPKTLNASNKVFIIDVFHHVPPALQKDFLQTLYKNMSQGSILIFKDINRASPFVFFNKIHDLIFASEIGNEISLSQAKKNMQEIGFKIQHTEKERLFVYPHYTIIAIKE